MTDQIYNQLARTNLLTESLSAEILAGNVPPIEEIITPLLIGEMDCEGVIASGRKPTLNERLLSRQSLIIAFLLAIVAAKEHRD